MISFKIVALLLKQLLYYAELFGGGGGGGFGKGGEGRSISNKLINLGLKKIIQVSKTKGGLFNLLCYDN